METTTSTQQASIRSFQMIEQVVTTPAPSVRSGQRIVLADAAALARQLDALRQSRTAA